MQLLFVQQNLAIQTIKTCFHDLQTRSQTKKQTLYMALVALVVLVVDTPNSTETHENTNKYAYVHKQYKHTHTKKYEYTIAQTLKQERKQASKQVYQR
jgi:hypothetical protein